MPIKLTEQSPRFYVREREAPEKNPRQDSSVPLRWDCRAFWGVGEHLWGEEVNSDYWTMGFWSAPKVMFRAVPRPPWEPTYGSYTEITADRFALAPWNPASGWKSPRDHYRLVTQNVIPHWVTWTGTVIFSQADRQFVVKLSDGTLNGTDGATAALINCPRHRVEMEIAFFTTVRDPNAEFGRLVADRAFRIPKDGFRSRVRGIPYRSGAANKIGVYKNGELVGYGFTARDSTGFAPITDEDIFFAVGDVLTVRMPAMPLGARWAAFSLYCEAIQ